MKIKATILLSFLGVFFLTNISAQGLNKKDAKGEKHGKWTVFYEKTTVPKYIGQFKHGKPHGTFTYYYKSNKVKGVMKFEAGGKISRILLYHENGEPMAFGKYINKLKDSVWVQYGPSGKISYTETYKLGKLDGEKIIYYIFSEDKRPLQISKKLHFKEGVAEGDVVEYFPDGVLKMKGAYKNGRLEGKVEYFNPSGSLARICRYKNHLKHGWWIAYGEDGKESNRMYYWMNKELKGKDLDAKMKELKAKGINPNG